MRNVGFALSLSREKQKLHHHYYTYIIYHPSKERFNNNTYAIQLNTQSSGIRPANDLLPVQPRSDGPEHGASFG
jgi:hypothetical protein